MDQAGMRQEITERVKLLHQLIYGSTLLSAFFVAFGSWLYMNVPQEVFNWYLLLIPVVIAGLVFNYQSNQMTMEAVAGYLKSADDGWEKHYGNHKQGVQLTSFLKVTPLLLPLLLPFIIEPLTDHQMYLRYFDFALLLFVIANFRYKLLGR